MSTITPTAQAVVDSMHRAAELVIERNAVYKDNYKMVGRIMEAMFPDGAPVLHDADDFNRWHIFELMVVKLSRYVVAYGAGGHRDSLDDLMVYAAMLGAIDSELAREPQPGADAPVVVGAGIPKLGEVGLLPDSRWRDRKAEWHAAEPDIHGAADRWIVSNVDGSDNDVLTRGDYVRVIMHRGTGPTYVVEALDAEKGVLVTTADGSSAASAWFNPAFLTSHDVDQPF